MSSAADEAHNAGLGQATAWMTLAAEDLRTLAWLHATERDSATWLALRDAGFPQGLTLLPDDDASIRTMARALDDVQRAQRADAPRCDDDLAADFADIYLTHALRASPCESVWCDEDHLMLQGPTFAVRARYREHGMHRDPCSGLADDHLSHELQFVAELLRRADAQAAAQFLSQHLLRWVPDFAIRVAERARTPVYASLAVLTHACLSVLANALGARAPAPARRIPVLATAAEQPQCGG